MPCQMQVSRPPCVSLRQVLLDDTKVYFLIMKWNDALYFGGNTIAYTIPIQFLHCDWFSLLPPKYSASFHSIINKQSLVFVCALRSALEISQDMIFGFEICI